MWVYEEGRLYEEDTEDEILDSGVRRQSVRPKEYLVSPYAQRQREKHKYDLSFGERNKLQTTDNNTTGIQMKRQVVDRKVNPGSRTRFQSSVFPRTAMMPRSPFRTETKQLNMTHDVPFRSRLLNRSYLEELDREPPDVVAEAFHRRHNDFVKVLKGCSKNSKLITVLFSVLAKITTAGGGITWFI